MATYSFVDFSGSITGPGGNFQLAQGAGADEGGFDIDMNVDKDVMKVGAGGEAMHNLVADKSGTITVRLLKTSPVNQQLMQMYNLQALSSATWGSNVLTFSNAVTGESHTGRSAAFKKKPKFVMAKEGASNEWVFNVGYIDSVLGNYAQ